MERVVATILGDLDTVGEEGDGGRELVDRVVVIVATNCPDLLDPSLL